MVTISTDIDGVLNDYPGCWIQYANDVADVECKSRDELRDVLGEDRYDEIKDSYRRSEYKATLPVNENIIDVLLEVSTAGAEVYVSTSRPIEDPKYPGLRDLTKKWLLRNNVQHDKLLRKSDLLSRSAVSDKLDVHIDDEYEEAAKFADAGVTVLLYANEATIDDGRGEISVVATPQELRTHLLDFVNND